MIGSVTILSVKVVDDVMRLARSERLPSDILQRIRHHIGQVRNDGWCNRCWLWNVVNFNLESWAYCDLVVGKVPNDVEAIKPCIGCGMRDPNLEFGIDPVEKEDWPCRLRDWNRRNRGALMQRQLRVLQWVPKYKVTIAIVGKEVGSRIIELYLRVVNYISDWNRRESWHYWFLIALSIMELVNEA